MPDPDAVPGLRPGAPVPPKGNETVDWITQATLRDRTVLAAIPPGFARYATIVIPDGAAAKSRADAALIAVLQSHTAAQSWWLGYLDTGVADVVHPAAPRVALYVGWPYVVMEAGPEQALSSRSNDHSTPWHSALPELLFPADRSWLVSTMWDDDWRNIGGPAAVITDLLSHPDLEARSVSPDEDAAPPGRERG